MIFDQQQDHLEIHCREGTMVGRSVKHLFPLAVHTDSDSEECEQNACAPRVTCTETVAMPRRNAVTVIGEMIRRFQL